MISFISLHNTLISKLYTNSKNPAVNKYPQSLIKKIYMENWRIHAGLSKWLWNAFPLCRHITASFDELSVMYRTSIIIHHSLPQQQEHIPTSDLELVVECNRDGKTHGQRSKFAIIGSENIFGAGMASEQNENQSNIIRCCLSKPHQVVVIWIPNAYHSQLWWARIINGRQHKLRIRKKKITENVNWFKTKKKNWISKSPM